MQDFALLKPLERHEFPHKHLLTNNLENVEILESKLLLVMCPLAGAWMGCHLLNLSPQTAVALPKPKHTMLPILIVLFVISYGLMAMVLIEQGKTIDVQRYLIGELFTDSGQLAAYKSAMLHHQAEAAKAKSQSQAPSSQAATPEKSKQHAAPMRPPKDTADSSDVRRSLVTI